MNTEEESYELLLQCYYSDQMSERQYQEHLQDKGFAEYIGRLL